MNSTYVISAMALGLGLLTPGLSAIERHDGTDPGAASERADDRRRFIERMDRELEDIDDRLGALRAEAKARGREGRQTLQRRIERLEKRRQRADRRLQELRSSTGRSFSEFREHVRDLVEDLREDVEDTEDTGQPKPRP